MSPLATPGTRGYPDWQRLQNWDSPSLFQRRMAFSGLSDDSGIMDVRLYQYLGGIDFITAAPGGCSVHVSWYQDPSGSTLVGEQIWLIDPFGSGQQQWRLSNVGPYARVVWTSIDGVQNFTHTCNLLGTNRFHQLMFIPPNVNPLYIVQGTNINAGAQFTHSLQSLYTGPARIRINTAAAAWSVDLQAYTAGGLYQSVDVLINSPPAATFLIPIGSSRLVVSNLDGVPRNFDIALTPAWLGSV